MTGKGRLVHHTPVWVPAELEIDAAGGTRPGFVCTHELENGGGQCGGSVFELDQADGQHSCWVAEEASWHEETFGTSNTTTGLDAVRDAYVAHLEAALRRIASGVGPARPIGPGVGPGFNPLSVEDCSQIAREALALGDIERIPDGVKFPPRGEVAFIRWPVGEDGTWHLVGPAVMLEPGTVIEVQKFTERDATLVAVGQIVAERTVIHRKEGPVQYVVARISRAVRD